MDFYGIQNFNKNQVQNMAIERVQTLPDPALDGRIVYLLSDKKVYIKFPSQWKSLAFGSNEGIPSGLIIGFYGPAGDITSIPALWYLCDGTNGTPDLRNRFIKSIKLNTDLPGGIGGSATHTHTITDHTHTVSVRISYNHIGSQACGGGGEEAPASAGHTHGTLTGPVTDGGVVNTNTQGTTVPITTDAVSSNPEYVELAFIMKA